MMSAMHLSLKMMSMSTLYFRLPALLLCARGICSGVASWVAFPRAQTQPRGAPLPASSWRELQLLATPQSGERAYPHSDRT